MKTTPIQEVLNKLIEVTYPELLKIKPNDETLISDATRLIISLKKEVETIRQHLQQPELEVMTVSDLWKNPKFDRNHLMYYELEEVCEKLEVFTNGIKIVEDKS